MGYKTVNRGWLRKQVEAGKVAIKCNYHYTDDYAFDAAVNFQQTDWMPARIRKPVFGEYTDQFGYTRTRCVEDDRKQGYMNLDASDFKSQSGRCWKNEETNIISFSIHSNLVYSCKVLEA